MADSFAVRGAMRELPSRQREAVVLWTNRWIVPTRRRPSRCRTPTVVFYGGDTIYTMDGDVDAHPEPIASAQDALVFVPSDHPRRSWAQHGPADSSARQMQEVSVDGTVTVGPVTTPPGNLIAALGSGVVLQRRTHQPLSQELHPDVHGIAIVAGRLTW